MKSKKGITFNLVTLIILAIVIFITVVLFIRMYQLAVDDGNRSSCGIESLKGQIQNIKPVNFWGTYELNCKAETVYLEFANLRDKSLSQKVIDQSSLKGKSETELAEPQKVDLQVRDYFARKMQSCWEITGYRSVFSNYKKLGTKSVADEDGRIVSFTTASQKETLSKYLGEYASRTAIDGLSVCMVCSNTYFDVALQDFGKVHYDQGPAFSSSQSTLPYLLNSYISQVPSKTDSKLSFLSEITKEKQTESSQFPIYFGTQTAQSVVYLQWFNSVSMAQDTARTAVVIIPTSEISNLCDVVTNQI